MRARRVALLLTAVLVFYVLLVGQRGLLLLLDGRPAFVLFGVGVLLLPVVGTWVVVKEIQFGHATQRLAEELSAQGGLPEDEVTRAGRVDRAAADAAFERRKAEVEAAPGDWRAWYRLAVAYSDAGDSTRGRRAMRRAIALRREHASPPS